MMDATDSELDKSESGDSDSERSEDSRDKGILECCGWVYHLGVNSIGHEYCHLRFLFIRGKYVAMYKRDPHQNPTIKPITQGVVGPTLMVDELGCRKLNIGDLYVVRFYNRLDLAKKGEIACPTAGEARRWIEAFDHAKQQAKYELSRGGSAKDKLNMEAEINFEGQWPRVRQYAHGLRKLIRIGQGPETPLRQSSKLAGGPDGFRGDSGDAVEAHQPKCVLNVAGIKIFEDVSDHKAMVAMRNAYPSKAVDSTGQQTSTTITGRINNSGGSVYGDLNGSIINFFTVVLNNKK